MIDEELIFFFFNFNIMMMPLIIRSTNILNCCILQNLSGHVFFGNSYTDYIFIICFFQIINKVIVKWKNLQSFSIIQSCQLVSQKQTNFKNLRKFLNQPTKQHQNVYKCENIVISQTFQIIMKLLSLQNVIFDR